MDRTTKGKTIFRSNIIIDGDLTEEQKQMVIDLAAECPVHKTLSNEIEFDTLQ